MRVFLFFMAIFGWHLSALSQQSTVIDELNNPIPNVAAFNIQKTKSILSNNDGVINLSRFIYSDSIIFQHPEYNNDTIVKGSVASFIKLTSMYNVLDDIIVSNNKNSNNIKNVAEKKIHITPEEIESLNASNPAELLEKKGGVSVQRSQMGGGSPNIRGFEANKVLLVIDGVRLNNAIYRSGHLQNIITIDEYMLEDIEIIFGPSSVLHGSDALGGTINMRTKSIYFRDNPIWKGSFFTNYNSAYSGFKNNISLSFESPNYSTITSFSIKRFGDLVMGESREHGYDQWGLVYHYVDSGGDIICNDNPSIQRGVGYSQYDFFNKMIYKLSSNWRITTNLQYSTSSNVPRFDKLNDNDLMCSFDSSGQCLSSTNLKFHSYYYGPQKRLFSSIKLTGFNHYFDQSDIIISYQKIEESRHKWYLEDYLDYLQSPNNNQNYDGQISQFEKVDIVSINTNSRKGDFQFGSESVYNYVSSNSLSNNNEYWGVGDTRYPPEGSTMFSSAYYVNLFSRISHTFQLEGGLRYTFSHIKSTFPDTMNRSLLNLEGLNLSSNNHILSGNMKFIYHPSNSWKISAVSSRGFHAPNIDDMMKIFLKGDNLTIPNIELLPEISLSQELSVTKNINNQLSIYGVGFYTRIRNAIIKDSMLVNLNPFPDQEPVYINEFIYEDENVYLFSNQNSSSNANIYGFTIGLSGEFNTIKISGDFNVTKGIDDRQNAGPLAHIPPNFGKLEFEKKFNNWSIRTLFLYAGEKPANTYDQSGVDNLNETAVIYNNEDVEWSGSPSWYNLSLYLKYQLNDFIYINIGLDNITDLHYKTFGSGLSAPGRSINCSIKLIFN